MLDSFDCEVNEDAEQDGSSLCLSVASDGLQASTMLATAPVMTLEDMAPDLFDLENNINEAVVFELVDDEVIDFDVNAVNPNEPVDPVEFIVNVNDPMVPANPDAQSPNAVVDTIGVTSKVDVNFNKELGNEIIIEDLIDLSGNDTNTITDISNAHDHGYKYSVHSLDLVQAEWQTTSNTSPQKRWNKHSYNFTHKTRCYSWTAVWRCVLWLLGWGRLILCKMCVCVCVCACVRIILVDSVGCLFICLIMNSYIDSCIHVCVCVCVCVCLRVCTHTCV